jgi:hypothetical protein
MEINVTKTNISGTTDGTDNNNFLLWFLLLLISISLSLSI